MAPSGVKPARRVSLQRKLRAVMLATTLVGLVVALAAMIGYDLRAYHQGWVNDLTVQAELIGSTAVPALEFDDHRLARDTLALLRVQPRVHAAAIYGPDGKVFAEYTGKGVAAGALPRPPGVDSVLVQGGELMLFKRIHADGQLLGTVYLRGQYELVDRVLSYAGIALLVTLMGMLAALAASAWLQRIVMRPILAVGAAARQVVERRDYSRRVDKRSDDEVGALVDAFNDMMGEIAQRTEALEASNREKAHEVEDRRRAQHEVMRLNDELERRVHERTAQLERSNAELVRATAAADEANRAKSEFLSNMSHELRTPLNAIIGFSQILQSTDGNPIGPDRHKAFLGHILSAGHHLLTLIDEILNLAQIEAGKLSVSVESVALADVLDECRTMTTSLAEQRGIRLSFAAPDGAHVQADRTRLKQVLLNLLSNAVKYNRLGGAVELRTLRPADGVLRLEVHDTGAGLSAEQIGHLFQPFNRLGRERGAEQGTGIGLVVTRRLVQLMGGSLGVNSTPGKGSVFWIDLATSAAAGAPVAQALDAALPPLHTPVDEPAAPRSPVTILCVDDNLSSLRLVEAAMSERSGVRVLTATNGRDGLELARRHRPDVILMDNNMPVLSGREAQRILASDPATAEIPVIAVSASACAESVAEGVTAGFFRSLTKPVDLAALNEAVDSALAQRAQRRG